MSRHFDVMCSQSKQSIEKFTKLVAVDNVKSVYEWLYIAINFSKVPSCC